MAQTFQGDVSFQLHNTLIPHRFEVSITEDDKIIIWIEDRQSKKQWHTDALDTSDFVTAENAIPKAKNRDYASARSMKFATCLKATGADTRYKRALSAKGTGRVLTLTLPLQWESEDLLLEYTFAMKEVPLERIDILGARVRDLEDKLSLLTADHVLHVETENEALKTHVARFAQQIEQLTRRVNRPPIFAQATASARPPGNEHKVVWVGVEGHADRAIEFLSTGPIRLAVADVYMVEISVTHTSGSITSTFELQRSGTTLASAEVGPHGGFNAYGICGVMTTPLHHVLRAEANDEILVVYKPKVNSFTGASITITKL